MHVDSASNAGGVGIYISDNIEFNNASSYSITVDGCENIWISINTNTFQKYLIGLMYRHPKYNVYEFTAKFNECLQKVNGANIKCFVSGDFNINLLNNTAASVISYINMLNSNVFFSLLDKPTRVTETSTLIDHIYCNDINCDIVPGVYSFEISDHFPIFACIRNVKKKPSLKPAVNEYRSMVKFKPLKYCNSLQVALENLFDDHTELTTNNFDNFFQLSLQTICSVIDAHAPLKRCSRKRKKLMAKSWISKGVFTSIRNKQQLYKSHYLNGSGEERSYYKRYANLLTKIKFAAKKSYFGTQLKLHSNNLAKMWKT